MNHHVHHTTITTITTLLMQNASFQSMLFTLPRTVIRIIQFYPQIRQLHSSPVLKMMKEKDVVSSFICTPPTSERGLTFALFKRSLNVSTYQ
jgi:hypothetical protein